MSKYNSYKAITVAGKLAGRVNNYPTVTELEAEAVDVILDLVNKIQEYEANEAAKKKDPGSSISVSTRGGVVPTWGGTVTLNNANTSTNLGYPKEPWAAVLS